jgi:hypothetical protein
MFGLKYETLLLLLHFTYKSQSAYAGRNTMEVKQSPQTIKLTVPGHHVTVTQYQLQADSANIILTWYCFEVGSTDRRFH